MTQGIADRPATESGRTDSVRSIVIADFVNVTWMMTAPVILFVGLGYGADLLAGTQPAGFLMGCVLGVVAGLSMGVRAINRSKGLGL